LVCRKWGVAKAVLFGPRSEMLIVHDRDAADIPVLESTEKMYDVGAFHFGHVDGCVVVPLADSGSFVRGAYEACLRPVGVARG
jgi:hypothetical protein